MHVRRKYATQKKRYRYFLSVVLLAMCGLGAAVLIAPHEMSDLFSSADIPLVQRGGKNLPRQDAEARETDLQQAPPFKGAWTIAKPALHHEIEGYATLASVAPSGTVGFAMSCKSSSFATNIFRMGWYNNTGAQLVKTMKSTACSPQKATTADPHTGLIALHWPTTLTLTVPSSWQPGYYLARMTTSQGYQTFVPFLVRSASVQHDVLFIHATATDAAYNAWGGNSLYVGSTPDLHITRGVKVSLDRPFAENNGAGNFLTWEYSMVKFLEQHQYGVDYASDIDIDEHPSLLQRYKAVIITGHDEYWTRSMLTGYESALNKGTNLAIFAANTAFRPTRYEPDPVTHQPDRVVVCYKNYLLDPDWYFNRSQVTAYNWRSYPIGQPESKLLGELYRGETDGPQALQVADSNSWIFRGTGLTKSSVIPGVVGYEYDEFVPTAPHPKNVDVIFASRVKDLNDHTYRTSDAVYYQLPGNGGQVFNAGTIEWSWGLDPNLRTYSSGLAKVTENILDRFGGTSNS